MISGNMLLLDCLKAWLAGKEPPSFPMELAGEYVEEITTSDGATMAPLGFMLSRYGFYEKLPPAQADRLRQYRHFLAANSAAILRDLDVFIEQVAREKIPVLILKGSALIKDGVYPAKGLRLLSDVDVLINKEDIAKTEILMDRIGWKCSDHDSELHENHHLPVRYSPGGFPLELHFALSRFPLDIDLDKIWERSRPLEGMPTVRIPSIEDTLFQLILNTSLHHPEKPAPLHFKFVVDFAFIWKFAGAQLDWEYLHCAAVRAGIETPFWNTFAVVCRLLDPPGLSEILTGYDAEKKVDNNFVDSIISGVLDSGRPKDLSWLVIVAAEEKNPLKRLFKSFQIIFPPRSFMKDAYPQWKNSPMIYPAYVMRIFKLIRNFNYKNFLMAYRTGKVSRRVGPPEE